MPFHANQFTFGIYGNELQRPENAADSIRSIAGSIVVNSNLLRVISSLEQSNDNGDVMIEVDLADALKIVQGLKTTVNNIDQSRVNIVLFVEGEIDFL